jgi:hypothetical protein
MEELVIPDTLGKEIEEIVFYCSQKSEIDRQIDPAGRKRRGVFINFHGDSGTGKTLAAEPVPQATIEAQIDEKSLDQVILDYLAAEAESEHLELSILNPCDFVSGQSVELRVAARKSLSQNAVEGAAIEVKMISTVEPPRVLFRGQTTEDGTIPARFNIPLFAEGTAAVIISAHSPLGNDEVKQLVKRKK